MNSCSAARGSQEAGFTQPRDHLIAHLSVLDGEEVSRGNICAYSITDWREWARGAFALTDPGGQFGKELTDRDM